MVRNSIVLLSGGIDSTACLYYYLNHGFNIKAVFIDYGQISSKKEFESAQKVASYYKLKLDVIKSKNLINFSQGEIKGRNAFLIFAILLNYPKFKGLLSLGIHLETPYYDCSELFLKNIQEILDGYTNGQLVLDIPFINWNKKLIFDYCINNKIPIHLTYSCENGETKPCGRCASCEDRRTLNVI